MEEIQVMNANKMPDCNGPMCETAHGILDRRIADLREQLIGYESIRKLMAGCEPGTATEIAMWHILTGHGRPY